MRASCEDNATQDSPAARDRDAKQEQNPATNGFVNAIARTQLERPRSACVASVMNADRVVEAAIRTAKNILWENIPPTPVTISAMSAADKPPEQIMDHGYAFKKCMSHADECVRLAGLTDDLNVRNQLLDLALEWMLAARGARRPSDDTRVVSLHKNLGDNVVPLHTSQDDDEQLIASKQSGAASSGKQTKGSIDDREQPQCDRNQARSPDR
jgi:hypothetical protein